MPQIIMVTRPRLRPLSGFLFVHFGEIIHMHPFAKLQVCSFGRFGDISKGVQNFIRVTWLRPRPFPEFLFNHFGEIVHLHSFAKFQVSSFISFGDMFEGVSNFIRVTWSRPHPFCEFLLLARYVPNVAKRSIWDQCKKKYILRTDRPATSDRRPTTDRLSHLGHIREILNGHISARGRPIHFMFGSTVGFSRSTDRMALFPVSPNPRWRLSRHLGKFKRRYLHGGSSDLHSVWC